jgi:hypothetical protein
MGNQLQSIINKNDWSNVNYQYNHYLLGKIIKHNFGSCSFFDEELAKVIEPLASKELIKDIVYDEKDYSYTISYFNSSCIKLKRKSGKWTLIY